jgi:cold-inducible RNA-binding protein
MAQKLFIGGLSFSTSTERLRELFAQVDGVESVSVVNDRDTGQSRGFGFVEMATSEAAAEAIKKFNGYQLDGRTLRVELSKPSAPRGGGGGGGFGYGGGGGGGGYGRGRR